MNGNHHLSEAQLRARRKGGLAKLKKYSLDCFRTMGMKGGSVGHGGRPRLKTIEEIRAELLNTNSKKEGCLT